MSPAPRPPAVRLDRLLANLGYGSRREIHALVRKGDVVLDGRSVSDAGARIGLTADMTERMTIQGVPVDPPAPLVLMLHKPAGVVCSHREPGRSVYELLPSRWRSRTPALSSVGRLDLDTTGLLLITDDGDFLHRVISPKSHAPKRYIATLAESLVGTEAESPPGGRGAAPCACATGSSGSVHSPAHPHRRALPSGQEDVRGRWKPCDGASSGPDRCPRPSAGPDARSLAAADARSVRGCSSRGRRHPRSGIAIASRDRARPLRDQECSASTGKSGNCWRSRAARDPATA